MNNADAITNHLKSNPGHVYITPDGSTMYMLVGPKEELMQATYVGKNFNDMSVEQIDKFIQSLFVA